MIILLIALNIVLFIMVSVLLLWLVKKNSSQPDWQSMIFQKFETIDSTIKDLFTQNTQIVERSQDRLSVSLENSGKSISQLQQRLVQLDEANKRIFDIGKDISSLQDILKTPKLRGGFGELFLGELLQQMLPQSNFKLQYTFKSGAMVDAAIFLGAKIVPVDSKFPLENFKKSMDIADEVEKAKYRKQFIADVKKHIDSIADKYIQPEENTFDFALMYIPAENVYYELIINDKGFEASLSAYAMQKKVIPVSPNSFYAYLQAILLGLRGLTIEKSAQVIMQNISQLTVEINKIISDFETMGTHVKNLNNSYEKMDKSLQRFNSKVEAINREDNYLIS